MLDGPDQQRVQQIPVGQRLLVQRLPAAPAADQVDDPSTRPKRSSSTSTTRGRVLVEDRRRARPALRWSPEPSAQLYWRAFVAAIIAPAYASRATTPGPSPPPAPAIAITRSLRSFISS